MQRAKNCGAKRPALNFNFYGIYPAVSGFCPDDSSVTYLSHTWSSLELSNAYIAKHLFLRMIRFDKEGGSVITFDTILWEKDEPYKKIMSKFMGLHLPGEL